MALRRRFAFFALDPTKPPVSEVLRRWVEVSHDRESERADLLELLNNKLADPDSAIGPSFLMNDTPLDDVWEFEILPLLGERFYGHRDLGSDYGLPALRAALVGQPVSDPAD